MALKKLLIFKFQSESLTNLVGWFASLMASVMYISYVDQIKLNLSGQPGSVILPIITSINCSAWILYALLKPKTDWPLLFCNFPGVFLGIITVLTAI